MGYTDNFIKAMGGDVSPYLKKKKKGVDYGLGDKEVQSTLSWRNDEIAPVRTNQTTTEDTSKIQIFQKSDLFDDGWQAGDVAKAILGTVGDFGLNIVKGFGGFAEGVADAVTYGIADIKEKNGKLDEANRIRQNTENSLMDEWLGGAQESLDQASVLGRTSKSGANAVGQMIPLWAIGTLTGGIGSAAGLGATGTKVLGTGVNSVLQGTSSYGANKTQALQEGATEEESDRYGLIAAAIDVGTEMLSGGMGKGANAAGVNVGAFGFDDMIAKRATKKISNTLAKNVAQGAIKAGGEGLEELLAGGLQAIAKWKTYATEKELTDLLKDENLLEQFLVGAFASGVMQTGDVYRSTKAGQDYVTGYTQSEQTVLDKVYEEELANREKDGKKLSGREKTKLYESIEKQMERGYIDTDKIESILGGDEYKAYKDYTNSNEALKAELEELRKMKNGDRNDIQNDRLAELKAMNLDDKTKSNELKAKLNEKVFPLVKDSRLVESYNERVRSTQDFVADLDKYKNTKHEDAAKKTLDNAIKAGLSNTNAVHDIVDMAANLSADTGYVYEFADNDKIKADFIERQTKEIAKLEAIENRTEAQDNKLTRIKELVAQVQSGEVMVNGNVGGKGKIVLNLDSPKLFSSTIGHEITHTLEKAKNYEHLRDSLFSYAKSKGVDINAELEMKAVEYEGVKGTTAEAELVADMVGDYLFTDSDFVQSLTTENRNIAQRIYDEIKYLLKRVTTGSKEERELLRVKHEFEKAFRNSGEIAKASTETIKAEGQELSDTDTQYSLRKADPPKETGVAYKVFFVKDGKLYPPMVANPDGADTPMGVWLDADVGTAAPPSKTGRAQVKAGGKGTQGGSGSLAFRPGWHLGDLPRASQFDRLNPETGKKELFPENFVWAEVEYAKDVDYQEEAMSYGYTDKGKFRHAYAGLPRLPENGYYRYRTNPKPDTVPWVITGSMKVNRLLSDAEVNEILEKNGVSPVHRKGGDVGLDAFGFNEDGTVKYSLSKTTDADYMKAVESGDTEMAQRMVDEAARNAGYTRRLYHGTASNFNVFGFGRTGIFTTDNYDMAKTYGNNVMSLYGKEGANVLTIDAQESPHYAIKVSKDILDFSEYPLIGAKETYSTNDISLIAFREGYDVVVIENVYDNYSVSSDNKENGLGTDIVYKDPNQVKSSEPVTYDDNGNVIPLSQRFNTENDDIRYSLSTDSKGRKLSKEQIDFFVDSKIRVSEVDGWRNTITENGALLPVYHGTNSGEFYEFDKKTIGSANDSGWFGKGFYFAFTEGEASYYGNRVLECYLDVKKPFVYSDEMETFNGQDGGDVNFDFAAFVINLSDKFPEIAQQTYVEVAERGSDEIIKKPFDEFAREIRELHDSDRLKLVEIDDRGKTIYEYRYSPDIDAIDAPERIKKIIKENHIDSSLVVDFLVKNSKITETDADIIFDLFEKYGDEQFDDVWLRSRFDSKEYGEKNRLSAVVQYLANHRYSYIDQHLPHYYMMHYVGDSFTQEIRKRGYDGVLQSRYGDEVVVFDSNQIKLTTNKTPTTDPDIRYSLSDSDGKQLSNEQRDYFKNSKLRDDNGNLLVMYHGSQNLGFTVFDPNASDDNKSFFFSDKPSVAASYSDSTDEIAPYVGDKSSGLYKTYLNLENPYVVDARGAKWNNVVEFAEGDEFLSDIGAYMGIIRNMDSSLTIEDFLDSVRGDLVSSTDYAINELFVDEDTEESHFTAEEQQELRELAQRINDAYMEWDEEAHIDEDGDETDFESYVRQNYTMKTTRQIAKEAYKNGYDGVIFKNIVDVGKFANGAQQNYDKSTVAVAFDSKQVKAVDNSTPTDDPDIRFSLSKPVEQTKDLVALHNLTADKLTKSLELGGLPMPSLAITKADIPHSNFGEITLVFSKETIDPKANKKNKVYSADAWTPIFPTVEYEADSKVVNRVSQKLRDLGGLVDEEFQNDLSRIDYSIEDYLNREGGEEGLIQYVMNNYGLKAAYLEDIGKHIEKVTQQVEVPRNFNPNSADKYEKIMDILGVTTAEEIWHINLKEARDNHGEELDAVFPGTTKSALRMGKVLGMVGSYIKGKDSAPEYKTVTDTAAMKSAVDAAIDTKGYEEWVRSLFSGVVKDSGIYNNKDLFTPSGNRRTFKQTHLPVTLENIVKAMASQNDGNAKNVSGFNGVKTLRAATAETFKSIDEMHQREGRLQRLTQEQADEITDTLQNRLSNIINDIDNENAQKGDGNPYIRYDQIGQAITEIGEGGKYNIADIQSVFSEYGRTVSDDIALDVKQLLYEVSQMPVNIFEAKPQRVVGFDEAKVFVIPRNANVELKQELLNRGYSIAEYDPDVEGDRQKVVNSFEEYKFSLSKPSEYIAPPSDYPFYGRDLRKKPIDDIAPTAPVVGKDTNVPTNAGATDDIAPPVWTVEAPTKETTTKQEVENVLGNRDSFTSNKANALYEEVKGMRKGVRVSGDLSYLLDTLDLSEENKANSYKSLRTALLNVKARPNQVVNPNSAIESTVREMIAREYDSMVEDLARPDGVTDKIFSKMKGIRTELDSLTKLQEQSKADFDADIATLQAEYDAKKNKNTKVANDLLRRIESKKRMKDNVDADYARRIEKLNAKLDKMSQPEYKRAMQRRTKQAEYIALAERLVGNTATWVDKKFGLSYKVNTLRRNLRDVVRDANGNKDFAKADAIYDEYQGKFGYNHNEAELKRESMRLKDPFVKLGLNDKESTYAMMLGEFRHNPDTRLTEAEVKEYYEKHKRKIDTKKVDQGIDEARKLFDELLPRVNERLKEQGMKEIPYRKGYFPHFENPKQGWLAKLLNWKTVDTEIPTSIAGLTEGFNPQKSYQSFDKHRKGDTTDYNLNQAIDSYVHGALDWIYHIEDIQKRRALENHIRYVHSEEGVKRKIDEIRNSEVYDADEAQAQIDAIYAEAKNPLNNFVTDLRAGTNLLANKKSSMDRGMEEATNRKIYSVMTNLNNRINANMVVGSISSALTNFIPITQSWMEVSPLYTLRGMRDTIKSVIRDDGMVNKSDYLTNRLMNEENLNQTLWDKASNKAAFMMEAIDNFSSQTIWRSKYLQNLHEGMSEVEAMKNADQFAENVMAGRSRGNTPTIFEAKNPFTKIFTAFQLEVNNQYQYMFKDAPQDSKSNIRLVKGYATAFIGAYVYNALYSSLTGRNAAFDPISIIEDLFRDLFGEDEEEPEEVVLNLVDNVLEEVPFVGGFVGGGRIPISSAMPYNGDYKTLITDIANGEASTKEWLKPVYYLAMPFGGGQIKKTNEGLAMFSDDLPVKGSYTESGNLRYPVDDTLGNRVQAGLFGQYANKNARDYFDNNRSPLKPKQIKEYKDLDIPIRDYWDYRDGLNDLAPTAGNKSVTTEQKLDYIDSLDLPISKKNILANNVTDRKEDIDLTNYDDFGSLEEFDFANDNPEKYAVAKAVGGYSAYKKYSKALYGIKADKDADGKSINGSRKEKVMAYIESLDVDYHTKIILHKMEYNADDTYNAEIVEYIIGRDDLTFEEKTALFEELGFKTSNGQVYWD